MNVIFFIKIKKEPQDGDPTEKGKRDNAHTLQRWDGNNNGAYASSTTFDHIQQEHEHSTKYEQDGFQRHMDHFYQDWIIN